MLEKEPWWNREILHVVIAVTLLAIALSCITSCTITPTIYTRQPLFDQRLAPTAGHKGLTNQVCKAWVDDKCTQMDMVEYDLALPEVRKQLVDLKFVCNVAGVRYGVDLARPELINQKCGGFFSRSCDPVDTIDVTKDLQKLINANTVCAAQDSAYGKSLFLK